MTDKHCGSGFYCIKNVCMNSCGDGSCQNQLGENCLTCAKDCSCKTDQKCSLGICRGLGWCPHVKATVDKVNCGGKICFKKKCQPWDCTVNGHCPSSSVCVNNTCLQKECSNTSSQGVYSAECYRKYKDKLYCVSQTCRECPDNSYQGAASEACKKRGLNKNFCIGYSCRSCPTSRFTSFPGCTTLLTPKDKYCAEYQCAQCPWQGISSAHHLPTCRLYSNVQCPMLKPKLPCIG